MFDLSLAHLARTDRERDLVTDLCTRRILIATSEEVAVDPAPIRRPAPQRMSAARVRAVGR